MAAALRRPSYQRRQSVMETGSNTNTRSAMIVTSAHTIREGQAMSCLSNYENSYLTEPASIISSRRLKEVVKNVLESTLTEREYKCDECGALTRKIADQIRQGAKALGYTRYKFVSLVSIGPPQPATISMSSRCVWNDKFDTFAEYVFQNKNIYAVGLVYGMYCE